MYPIPNMFCFHRSAADKRNITSHDRVNTTEYDLLVGYYSIHDANDEYMTIIKFIT